MKRKLSEILYYNILLCQYKYLFHQNKIISEIKLQSILSLLCTKIKQFNIICLNNIYLLRLSVFNKTKLYINKIIHLIS